MPKDSDKLHLYISQWPGGTYAYGYYNQEEDKAKEMSTNPNESANTTAEGTETLEVQEPYLGPTDEALNAAALQQAALDGLDSQLDDFNFRRLEPGADGYPQFQCRAEGHEAYIYSDLQSCATHFTRAHVVRDALESEGIVSPVDTPEAEEATQGAQTEVEDQGQGEIVPSQLTPSASDDARTLRNSDPSTTEDDEKVSAAARRLSERSHSEGE